MKRVTKFTNWIRLIVGNKTWSLLHTNLPMKLTTKTFLILS